MTPGVMLVTGAYSPEISSGGQQSRAVARELGDRVRFSVIATAVDRTLPRESTVEGVRVFRLPIDVSSVASRAVAFLRLAIIMLRERARFEVVHLHGVSAKNVPITSLARLMGKRIVLTMHTAGQDEPQAVAARGGEAAINAFKKADLVLSVSPVLSERYRDAGFPMEKLRDTINGIDIERFRPVTESARVALGEQLQLPAARVILFVGFFSHDKRPKILFDAWRNLTATVREPIALVFVGATSSPYFEIDQELAPRMRRDADAAGLGHLLRFVEFTNEIEHYYQAADVFVLPSVREALPMSLLEAMATGLPAIATRLPGATDTIVEDGKTGMLVEADDVQALASDLRELLEHPSRAWAIGAAARCMIESRFTVRRAAADWLAAYEHVLRQR